MKRWQKGLLIAAGVVIALLVVLSFVIDGIVTSKAHEQADQLVQSAFERGLLLLTAGSRAVRISPPLVLDSEDAATGLEIIGSALDALPA